MKYLYFSFLVIISWEAVSQPAVSSAITGNNNKPFEGSIYFSQEMLSDTFYYTYYIKGRMVRMDEYNRCKTCRIANNYLLFDLNKKTIVAVSPSRKMYLDLAVKPAQIDMNDENYKIIKTNNCKKIQNYPCYQWRVRNKSQNTEISYWVAKDNFDFFIDLLTIWNRSERHALYFLKIPDSKGYFPILSEERTTLREQKMTLRVISIEKKELDKNLFILPKDYKSYSD